MLTARVFVNSASVLTVTAKNLARQNVNGFFSRLLADECVLDRRCGSWLFSRPSRWGACDWFSRGFFFLRSRAGVLLGWWPAVVGGPRSMSHGGRFAWPLTLMNCPIGSTGTEDRRRARHLARSNVTDGAARRRAPQSPYCLRAQEGWRIDAYGAGVTCVNECICVMFSNRRLLRRPQSENFMAPHSRNPGEFHA